MLPAGTLLRVKVVLVVHTLKGPEMVGCGLVVVELLEALDSPAVLTAFTLKVYEVLAVSPVNVYEVPVVTLTSLGVCQTL